jgi:hypothetical protein
VCYDLYMNSNSTALVLDTPGIEEVLNMLREDALFASTPELRAICCRLLAAGYTPRDTASKLRISESTIWGWCGEGDIKRAISEGKEHRRKVLSSQLESAAMDALDTLRDVLSDPDVPARDKIKAAEQILDRCGIAPASRGKTDNPTGPVIIDVDFDERLARIVATGQTG